MTSAERRAAREAEQARGKAHDLLVAVLLAQGGHVRIPWSVVESGMRSSVTTVREGDELVIWLGEPEHRPEPARPGLLGRLTGRA